jgi:hypothetical protein
MTGGAGIDLGASGFVVAGKFVLAQGGWAAASEYVAAVQAVDASTVPFADVRQSITGLQASAGEWQNTIYPSMVSLASSVYDYGSNKVPVYVPALAKELTALGADPTSKQALAAVDAIVDNLSAFVAAQPAAASKADAGAAQFEQACAAGEQQLRTVATAYATMYSGPAPAPPVLPQGFQAVVNDLAGAWTAIGAQLARLKSSVADKVKAGKPFTIDVGADTAVSQWQSAAQAADAWRTGAYTR